MSTGGRVRRRHSLLTRLLVVSVAIVLLAVSATAWLAVRTATNAIQQQQGQSLTQAKALYDQLQGYAATHRDWTGVAPLVRAAAAKQGRRVVLTTTARRVLADSAAAGPAVPSAPLATIDPLRPDPELSGGTGTVDPRVVGPYRLSKKESSFAKRKAHEVVQCLNKVGVTARAVPAASGRPEIVTAPGTEPIGGCSDEYDQEVFPTEKRALRTLIKPTRQCAGAPTARFDIVAKRGDDRVTFLAADPYGRILPQERLQACLEEARRVQLQPYAAPPALLFVTDSGAERARVTFPLTGHNLRQIALVTGGVLLAAIVLTVLLSRRLTRPLRVLADGLSDDHPRPVAVSGRDEIGRLAAALDQAMRRRDAAEGQRRAMVADVAHELRNPLTNMRSWLESAQDGLTPVDNALVDLLHEETTIVQHILDDLADLAAADAGTLRLHPEPIDLGECLVQAVDATASAADAAGVGLVVRVPQAIGITADPVRVRQLIGNLVSNAIRYTPAGGQVVVGAATVGTAAVIEVADTGIGIAPEHLSRVFDRFWRADDSRTRATGGSGLGLAIVRQLVEAHAGTVTVESAVGVGTRFTVRLPAATAPLSLTQGGGPTPAGRPRRPTR